MFKVGIYGDILNTSFTGKLGAGERGNGLMFAGTGNDALNMGYNSDLVSSGNVHILNPVGYVNCIPPKAFLERFSLL